MTTRWSVDACPTSSPVAPAGLPMGVQLIGRPGGEDVLFSIGAQLERRIAWQERHPPGWS